MLYVSKIHYLILLVFALIGFFDSCLFVHLFFKIRRFNKINEE